MMRRSMYKKNMVFKTIIHDVIPNITPEEWGKGRHNDAIL